MIIFGFEKLSKVSEELNTNKYANKIELNGNDFKL